MPGWVARERTASGRRVEEMARRSRTSMGAVVWLTPMRTSEPACAGCGSVSDGRFDDGEALGLGHGVANLWTAENWFAAQTKRTTRMTKLER